MVECRHKFDPGLTLVEVLVALGLIALSAMLVLGLVPAGISTSQRAAEVQMAAAWTRKLLEEAPQPTSSTAATDLVLTQQIGDTKFTATRKISIPGDYLYKIEVETRWDAGVEPVRLSLTRFNPAGPPFAK